MAKSKHTNKICIAVIALMLVITILFMNGETLGIVVTAHTMGYENRLFDTSRVHTIDIVMDDWDSFISAATSEEYSMCTIVIDGEKYSNVAIRGKGNSSLSSVAAYGNDRYSFKVEFDHYVNNKTYYGLDKLALNNIIQDNTYMKDYLSYTMMSYMGIASPLCSFVYITVNGEDWGLYLAVEGVEEGFLERNYGTDYGNLYKPDTVSMGGGRGNGQDFNMDDILEQFGVDDVSELEDLIKSGEIDIGDMQMPNMEDWSEDGDMQMPEGDFTPPEDSGADGSTEITEDGNNRFNMGDRQNMAGGGGFGGMSSSDVKLQYIDDDPSSYTNIFDNAKTDIAEDDQTRLIESLKTLSEGEDIESVVDIEAVIKYFVVHDFVQNGDSYTGSMVHNYYLYEDDGVLSMIPWDYNLAFGAFNMGTGNTTSSGATSVVNSPIDSPVSSDDIESRPMVAWIFESEEYTELYHQYYAEFIDSYFTSGYFEQMYDEVVAMISPYVEKDPTKFCTYDEFVLGTETLKEFCLLRAESVLGQLDGTIPSTQEGQSEDSSTLIDASHINTSDMGSMNNGMGGGMNGNGEERNNGMWGNRIDPTTESESDIDSPDSANDDESLINEQSDTTNETDEVISQQPSFEINGDMPENGESPEGMTGDRNEFVQPRMME